MTAPGGIFDPGVPRPATDTGFELGEGPVWDPVRERLLWVDILDGAVLDGRLDARGDVLITDRIDFPSVAGAVAVSTDGRLVVAGADRLHFREPDGTLTAGPSILTGIDRRFNDGKPDPAGLLVAGTKSDARTESLLRFEADGRVTVIDDDLTLSNGIGWSPDGSRMYNVDTFARLVYMRDYDPVTGATGQRAVFATVGDGLPDGLTVDADGHVWLALWGAGRVLRYSPAGEIVGRVDVPAPHTSSVAFAGADLGTLVITTAREDLTSEQLRDDPHSGRLFTLRPGVSGAPVALWSGTPASPRQHPTKGPA
ncbi:SMP-30/gluconolactonase/LRE family protein [Leifsonia poae]|uniref:SMP-30/gluconolactonase/LRE family protein n=1 Tax=Leifsonia poae TaxID=110933 RepID=UPI001CBC62CD|nr:SMP-30/gluconolactonase/LRE family protein [Leifsonia poae]